MTMRLRVLAGVMLAATGCASDTADATKQSAAPSKTPSLLVEVLQSCRSCASLLESRTAPPAESQDSISQQSNESILGDPSAGVLARVPASANGTMQVSVPGAALTVGVKRPGAQDSKASKEKGTLAWHNIAQGLDALLFEQLGAIEELLVVRSPGVQAAYELVLPSDVQVRTQSPNTLVVVRGATPLLRFSAQRGWDSQGKPFSPQLALQGNRVVLSIPPLTPLPAFVDPTWETTNRMVYPRHGHGAAVLPSGKVLFAGGCADWDGLDDIVVPCKKESPPQPTAEIYDPQTGTFSDTGSMQVGRHAFTLTTLPSGRVLALGGCSDAVCAAPLDSAELYDPTSGTFAPLTAKLAKPRYGHTTTRLLSGSLLIAGGKEEPDTELFVPEGTGGKFDPGPALSTGRFLHTANLLPTGKVLVAGGRLFGSQPSTLKSAELYDPATGSFSPAGDMPYARRSHTATTLRDGSVLVAGGTATISFDSPEKTAARFIPATNSFVKVGAMSESRRSHASVLLPSGKVLVLAGCHGGGACFTGSLNKTADLFDPSTNTFTQALWPLAIRRNFTATVLASGRVLVAGGVGSGMALKAAEVYDPVGLDPTIALPPGPTPGVVPGSTKLVPTPMTTARLAHSATLLKDGTVLLAGGVKCTDANQPLVCGLPSSQVERYNPITNSTTPAGTLVHGRLIHRATPFRDSQGQEKVLLSGGCDTGVCIPYGALQGKLKAAEIYDPATNTSVATGDMAVARTHHSSTLLPDGKILVAGGCTSMSCAEDGTEFLSSAELFDPATGTFSTLPNLSRGRVFHSATVLESGKVLLLGGRDTFGSVDESELFDPITKTFSVPPGTPKVARTGHLALLMPTGAVLLAGGLGASGLTALTTYAEFYQPLSSSSTMTLPSKLVHFWPDALPLQLLSGKAALYGGYANLTATFDAGPEEQQRRAAVEIFDPWAKMNVGYFSYGPSLQEPRGGHTRTRLATGEVLIAGGCDFDTTDNLCAGNVVSATMEIHNDGTLPEAGFRPQVEPFPAPATAVIGNTITVKGNGFLGLPGGGSGNTSDSSSANPTALWFPQVEGYPLTGELVDWSDTQATWKVPLTGRLGPGWFHVVVQGVPSVGVWLALTPAAQGSPCAANAQCTTSACVDGVCCDSACAEPCKACSAAKKGQGTDGVCENVVEGTDPDDDCLQDPLKPCGNDGLCNGQGSCRLAVKGWQCGSSSCEGLAFTPPSLCDGNAQCVSQTKVECSPYLCTTQGCTTSCSSAADCAPDRSCVLGKCQQRVEDGSPCAAPEACVSANCVSGVCCTPKNCWPFACGGTAQDKGCLKACSKDTDCAQDTHCDKLTGQCVSGALCLDDRTLLDNQGKTRSCVPFKCESGVCRSPCVTSEHCVSGYSCDRSTGLCVQPEQASAEEASCLCQAPGKGSTPPNTLLLVIAGALGLTRRRRALRSSQSLG